MVKAIKVTDWFGHVSRMCCLDRPYRWQASSHRVSANSVGAGLPAMAVGQATDALNQTASLRINVR